MSGVKTANSSFSVMFMAGAFAGLLRNSHFGKATPATHWPQLRGISIQEPTTAVESAHG